MKKILCIIFICMFVLSVAGCAASSNKTVVLPPTRIGRSLEQATFGNKYTFASAFSEADVVARIEVGNWINEDTNIGSSYYEASVLQCFKGDIPQNFTLIQDGCSSGTLKSYPLFTSGNEILVFLNEANVTDVVLDYDSPYWIIGAYTTLFDVVYDDSGNRYYSDRYGILGETIHISTNYALQDEIFTEIYSNSVRIDSIVEEMQYSYPYVFSENDLTTLLEGQ